MVRYLRVEGYQSLVRDLNSNAIINDDTSSYSLYMKRIREREKDRENSFFEEIRFFVEISVF